MNIEIVNDIITYIVLIIIELHVSRAYAWVRQGWWFAIGG